jgi:hypothetical protein
MVRCFFYSLFRFSLQKNGLVLEKEQEEKGQEGEEGEEEDHQQQALSFFFFRFVLFVGQRWRWRQWR